MNSGNVVTLRGDNTPMEIVPDVKGMGAKDAVYMLESRGLKVKLEAWGVWFRRASRRTSNIRKANHTD